jgi:hypothetical protein
VTASPAKSSYLNDVAPLPQRLRNLLVSRRPLTGAEESELDAEMALIKQRIRERRSAWEASHGPIPVEPPGAFIEAERE